MNSSQNPKVQQVRGALGHLIGRISPSDYLKESVDFSDQYLLFEEIIGFVLRVTSKCFNGCYEDLK